VLLASNPCWGSSSLIRLDPDLFSPIRILETLKELWQFEARFFILAVKLESKSDKSENPNFTSMEALLYGS
jgi:hypothetical protein